LRRKDERNDRILPRIQSRELTPGGRLLPVDEIREVVLEAGELCRKRQDRTVLEHRWATRQTDPGGLGVNRRFGAGTSLGRRRLLCTRHWRRFLRGHDARLLESDQDVPRVDHGLGNRSRETRVFRREPPRHLVSAAAAAPAAAATTDAADAAASTFTASVVATSTQSLVGDSGRRARRGVLRFDGWSRS
jgi:hypothetical protein